MASRGFSRILLPATLVLVAALLRVSPASEVFPPDGPVRLVSADCEQHAGRVERVVAGLPLRVFDPDLNFPDDGICVWPPLFDEGAGLFVTVLRVVFPQAGVIALAAWWPLLLGCLVPLVALALARRSLPRRWTLAAAAWAAGFPGTLLYSQLGHLDHHVAEALLATLASVLLAWAVRVPRARLVALGLAGAVLGVDIMTWHGAVYLAPVLLVALFAADACRRRRPAPRDVAALLAPALAITLAITALTLRGEPAVPFTWVSISWFQPAFLALAWCGGAALAWPLGAAASRRERAWAAAGVLAGIVALACAGPAMVAGTLTAAEYFTGGSAVAPTGNGGILATSRAFLSTIAESRPLAAWPAIVTDAPRLITWPAMIALAVAILLWTRDALRGRAMAALLLVLTGAHVALALSQQRYVYYLAAFAGIAVAAVIREAALRTRRRILMRLGPLLALALLLSALPQWTSLPSTVQAPKGDAADFLVRLRETIPPPARDDSGRAEWGIMAPWALGHTLRQWTKIPVAADNFGYGFEDQARTYLARGDGEALAILARRRCRYVLTTQFQGMLERHAAVLGLPPPGPDSFGMRLHRGEISPELLRPVLDSRSGDLVDGKFVPRLRLFEVVAPVPAASRSRPQSSARAGSR